MASHRNDSNKAAAHGLRFAPPVRPHDVIYEKRRTKMKVNIEDKEVADYYEELNFDSDAIFVPVANFRSHIVDALPESSLPTFFVAGEAILLSYHDLKRVAISLRLYINRNKLTYKEGGFWIAELESWKPPKGDIMNRCKRQGGSFGSRQ